MKLSYQSIKQIDRFSGIFIWVVVAPYAFAVALIFMWAFYIKDNPTARISDFVIPVCTGITCVATMANGFFSFDANRKRVRRSKTSSYRSKLYQDKRWGFGKVFEHKLSQCFRPLHCVQNSASCRLEIFR